jgi:Domain of unknown function (DUF4328)/Protein of unknown function (DUF2510)
VAGWYTDPWDPRGQRWWDGTAWSAYTDAHYGTVRAAVAPAAASVVSELVGPTRWLGLVLPLGVALQTAGLVLSWGAFRDLFRHLRDNDLATLSSRGPNVAATLGQALSLASIVVLVLRIVWLHRATAAAAATSGVVAGVSPRRSPGLACCGWLIPIVNLWWPFQGMQDVCPNDGGTRRQIGWWWTTYLFGALGGTVALFATVATSSTVAAVAIAVPSVSLVVSAVLERRLVVVALHEQAARAGLNLADSGPTDA